jgi:hypothetical protein
MVWGPFPCVGRVAFPYVPLCDVASRVLRSLLLGLVSACHLCPSLCILLSKGVAYVFVRGWVYYVCGSSPLCDEGKGGGSGYLFRFWPVVGIGGISEDVVGSSPSPPRPAWVCARQRSGVMLWCGASERHNSPFCVREYACVEPHPLPSSL